MTTTYINLPGVSVCCLYITGVIVILIMGTEKEGSAPAAPPLYTARHGDIQTSGYGAVIMLEYPAGIGLIALAAPAWHQQRCATR